MTTLARRPYPGSARDDDDAGCSAHTLRAASAGSLPPRLSGAVLGREAFSCLFFVGSLSRRDWTWSLVCAHSGGSSVYLRRRAREARRRDAIRAGAPRAVVERSSLDTPRRARDGSRRERPRGYVHAGRIQTVRRSGRPFDIIAPHRVLESPLLHGEVIPLGLGGRAHVGGGVRVSESYGYASDWRRGTRLGKQEDRGATGAERTRLVSWREEFESPLCGQVPQAVTG